MKTSGVNVVINDLVSLQQILFRACTGAVSLKVLMHYGRALPYNRGNTPNIVLFYILYKGKNP
jgi:hypothetical protein